jgi:anthranilate synthase/aminodeoxychorismate synthase-like glutamine amidotransferase
VKLLLIDHEDSFVYNLAQAFGTLGADVTVLRYTEPRRSALDVHPDFVVLSPGPGSPADPAVTGLARSFLADPKGPPILGVCLGHQLIGSFFGGRVIHAATPVHGEVAQVTHDGVGLFQGLPSPFAAARYHSLVVDPARLPAVLEVTARTSDGAIMAIQHRDRPIYGVQFHPESFLTRPGPRLLENFLDGSGR